MSSVPWTSNFALGYIHFLEGDPIFIENRSYVFQSLFFGGADPAVFWQFIRGTTSFFGSVLVPFLGFTKSYLIINIICWFGACWIAFVFAKKLWDDEIAGMIAALLVVGGIGYVAHQGDYSAHTLGFASYYLGAFLIYRSNVWRQECSWRVHVALGAYFAVSTLVYNMGLTLIVTYAAVGILTNPWKRIFVGCLVSLSAQSIWVRYVSLGKGLDLYGTERDILSNSIEVWGRAIRNRDQLMDLLSLRVSEFVFFFDSPGVVVFGLIAVVWAMIVLERRLGVMLFLTIFMPFFAAMVYVNSNTARGYVIFHVTLTVYVALAGMLATLIKNGDRRVRLGGIVLTALILCSHILWSTAHIWSPYYGALMAYVAGTYMLSKDVLFMLPEAMSLTGNEPVPGLLGGPATVPEAGAYTESKTLDYEFSFLRGIANRLIIFGYLVLIAVCVIRSRRMARKTIAWMAFFLVLLPPLAFQLIPVTVKDPGDHFLYMPKGATLTYTVELAPEIAAKINEYAKQPNDHYVEVFTRPQQTTLGPPMPAQLFIGDQEAPFAEWNLRTLPNGFEIAQFASALEGHDKVKLVVRPGENPASIAGLHGWQRAGLEGRHLEIIDANGNALPRPEILPTFEIRVMKYDPKAVDMRAFLAY